MKRASDGLDDGGPESFRDHDGIFRFNAGFEADHHAVFVDMHFSIPGVGMGDKKAAIVLGTPEDRMRRARA